MRTTRRMRARFGCVAWVVGWAGVAATLTSPSAALAQPPTDAVRRCVDAHGQAQENRKKDDLLRARADLEVCARPACPSLVQSDCTVWLAEVVEAIPSVVLEAKIDGDSVFDVSVSMDGTLVASQLNGRPIDVNPGLHTFVFERPDRPAVEKKVIVAAHQRSQLVSAAWKSLPPAAATATTTGSASPIEVPSGQGRPLPLSFYVLSGISAASFATFAILGVSGNSTKHDLETSCSPNCSDSDVSSLKTRYIAADVFVGVGALAAAGALGVLLFHPRDAHTPRTAIAIAPTTGGIAADCRVRF